MAAADDPRARRAGDESWGGVPFEDRKHVGAWMVPSYDPALNLVYIGTSVTSPAPKFLIGGITYAVDGRQYVAVSTRPVADLRGLQPANPGTAPERGEHPVRVRTALTRSAPARTRRGR